jgi:ABC-type multidrug transport system fused ATPase/permease subunit|tara:strand:- start:401 stop:832 length:432 start_codon:yes stop_codon:yes gene_type:complete
VNRIYDADAGRIEVGGRNIRDWAPSYLRSQISISRQKPSLFYGSIRENVAFGAEERLDAMPSENARRDAVYDAMRAVAMHDIIMEPPPNGKFPQRYRSMLYPGYGDCSTLNAMSGGERIIIVFCLRYCMTEYLSNLMLLLNHY